MKSALVITTIHEPHKIVEALAEGSIRHQRNFIVIGDRKGPKHFDLEGAWFVGINEQENTGFSYPKLCPYGHYARKNIGYLLAMSSGAEMIQETDDDNIPYESFWEIRDSYTRGECFGQGGWLNVYRLYSELPIWPRGFPLQKLRAPVTMKGETSEVYCPIQQGLAEDNPDVDAIYRLVFDTEKSFRSRGDVILRDTYCPFNSQNTQWRPEAYILMYLPAFCSFRMTDIWRSFIAQRIAYANGWGVCFHNATVYQERNEHNLLRDFEDEVVGYLRNEELVDRLMALELHGTKDRIGADLTTCYQALCEAGFFGNEEIELVKAWVHDCYSVTGMHLVAP